MIIKEPQKNSNISPHVSTMCNPRILPNLSQQYVLIFCEKITNSDCSFSKNNLGNNYHVSKDTNKPLISRHTVNKWN